ncbi:MAG: hypothetical protein V7K50_26565 [Nostoc sp.]
MQRGSAIAEGGSGGATLISMMIAIMADRSQPQERGESFCYMHAH